jgi:DNA polymerase III epsilon subunit-like protein
MRKSPEQFLRRHVETLPPRPDLVFVDTETGGLYADSHDIVEFAAIRVDSRTFVEIDRVASKIRPMLPVSPGAAKINGYNEAGWKDAPTLAEFAPYVRRLVDGARWAGSNPNFDRRFLDAAFERARLPLLRPSTHRMVDVSAMVEPLLHAGLMERSGLDAIRGFLDMPTPPDVHRAESDAESALEVYRRLVAFYAPALVRRLPTRETVDELDICSVPPHSQIG